MIMDIILMNITIAKIILYIYIIIKNKNLIYLRICMKNTGIFKVII